MASRSCGGTNFGEVAFSQPNAASIKGWCLANPPHAAESLSTASRPIFPNTAPARNTAVRQRPRLSIRLARRRLTLVKAQEIEGEEHCQRRRFGPKEWLQAEPVSRQIVLQLLNPLLDRSPPVVVAPQCQGPLAPVGHPHPERVTGHVQQPPPHRVLAFPHPFPQHHKPPALDHPKSCPVNSPTA